MLRDPTVDPSLARLPELGHIETEIETDRRRLGRIPEERSSLEAEIARLQKTLNDEKEKVAALEKERRSKEKDLADEVEHIRQRETKLMEIKTNKEYQAAVKEVETAKGIITADEDKILELMAAVESHTRLFQEAEKKLKAEESAIRNRLSKLKEEEETLQSRIADLETKRDALLQAFTPQTRALLDRARAARSHPLAEVLKQICQACHINIPPQLSLEIRKLDRAYPCPSCHRILYFDPAHEVEKHPEV